MGLKLIHTGDWHLGKKLYKRDRFEEHDLFLDWLVKICKEEDVDALIISGDIFDSPTPPHRSLQQFFKFIENFLSNTKAYIYAISGNHDSGQLLEAANPLFPLLENDRIFIRGVFDTKSIDRHFFTLEANKRSNEKIGLFLFPYFRSMELTQYASKDYKDDGSTLDKNTELILSGIENLFAQYTEYKKQNKTSFDILVAHHLFGSFQPSGTEQGLHLSGLESIPLSKLEGIFDYVALGHIHRPQVLKKDNPTVIYPGSPLYMRFSEINKKKIDDSKQIVLIDTEDSEKYKIIQIPPFRKLLSIEGSFDKDLDQDLEDSNFIRNLDQQLQLLDSDNSSDYKLECWMECQIWLNRPEEDIQSKTEKYIHKKWPELLNKIEIIQFNTFIKGQEKDGKTKAEIEAKDFNKLKTEELFKVFYKSQFPSQEEIPKDIGHAFLDLLQKVRHQERQD